MASEDGVPLIADHQPGLPTGRNGDLSPHISLRRGGGRGLGWTRRLRRWRLLLAPQVLVVRAVRVRAGTLDDLGPVSGAQLRPDLRGCTGEHRDAGRGEHHHLVAHLELGRRRLRHQNDATLVGESSQRRRNLLCRFRFEPGGRLFDDQQRRVGHQFHGKRCPLALLVGQGARLGGAQLWSAPSCRAPSARPRAADRRKCLGKRNSAA